MSTVNISSAPTASSMVTFRKRPGLRVHRRFPQLLGIHLAEALVALEARAFARAIEGERPELVQARDRRLVAVVVEQDRRALGRRRQLLPQLQERDVVRRLEELGAERHHRRARHDHGLRVAVVARARLDAVPVDRARRGDDRGRHLGVADAALVAAELLAQELGEHVGGHPAPGQLGEETAVLGDRAQQLEERVAGHRGSRAGHLDLRGGHPGREEELLELALVHQVLLDLALLDLEQRRLGDEEVPRFDHRVHVAEEEGQQQRPDVRAVDVGVGHQDDLVIAQLRDVELFGADAGAHAPR